MNENNNNGDLRFSQEEIYDYNASTISEDTMVEKHRKFPAQFLGDSDLRGARNQLYEILDNSWDECAEHNSKMTAAGTPFKSKIILEIHKDDRVTITDNGRGLPCGIITNVDEFGRVEEIPAIYKIFEREGAGGKARGGEGYKTTTAGQHGTGSAVVNSTCEFFKVTTSTAAKDSPGIFQVEYFKGRRVRDLAKIGEVQIDPETNLPMTGTTIEFKYDPTIFTPTINGTVGEVFDKNEIEGRIKAALYSLVGVDIEIEFRFKDYDVKIMTPSEFSPIKEMDTKYGIEANIKGNGFKCKIYIGVDETPHNSTDAYKTIVNRLSTTTAPINDMIKRGIVSAVGARVNEIYSNGIEFSENRSHLITLHCKTYNIMELENAQYAGQTKSVLRTDTYGVEFNNRFREFLMSEEFQPFRDLLASRYIAGIIQEREMAELDRKHKEEVMKRKEVAQEQTIINQALKDLADPRQKKRFQERNDSSKYDISVKDCYQDKKDANLVIVEGKSVSSSLNSLSEKRLPFAVCELGGKISNPYAAKKNFALLDDIKAFIYNCLAEEYKTILIMTDGDTDGLHMRMLVLAIMMICRDIPGIPDYIGERRVYIVNSPYSKMHITEDCEVNGKRYKMGPTFIPSYSETTELLNRKLGTVLRRYTGLSDIVSDLDPAQLVTNTEYHSQVQPPTPDELEMFENLMTRSHNVKKRYTLKRVTDRAVFTYNVLNMQDVKVPRMNLSKFPTNERPSLASLEHSYFRPYTPTAENTDGLELESELEDGFEMD